jgi:hypothetical protein
MYHATGRVGFGQKRSGGHGIESNSPWSGYHQYARASTSNLHMTSTSYSSHINIPMAPGRRRKREAPVKRRVM